MSSGFDGVVSALTQMGNHGVKRSRGRPRVYPVNETATERVNRSVKQLLEKGGARRTFRLSPEANVALNEIRKLLGKNDDTAVINESLIRTHKAILAKQKNT